MQRDNSYELARGEWNRQPSKDGQIVAYISPYHPGVVDVCESRMGRYGRMEWWAVDHDSPTYAMAAGAFRFAREHKADTGAFERGQYLQFVANLAVARGRDTSLEGEELHRSVVDTLAETLTKPIDLALADLVALQLIAPHSNLTEAQTLIGHCRQLGIPASPSMKAAVLGHLDQAEYAEKVAEVLIAYPAVFEAMQEVSLPVAKQLLVLVHQSTAELKLTKDMLGFGAGADLDLVEQSIYQRVEELAQDHLMYCSITGKVFADHGSYSEGFFASQSLTEETPRSEKQLYALIDNYMPGEPVVIFEPEEPATITIAGPRLNGGIENEFTRHRMVVSAVAGREPTIRQVGGLPTWLAHTCWM